MTRVLRVATVGNPNVGKSSLINAIAGSNLSVCCRHDACKIWFEIDGMCNHDCEPVANP